MKIFIVKGLIRGMVKLDNKLHFVGCGFDMASSVILFDGQKIKILDRQDFSQNIFDFNPVSIVLLNEEKKILCAGSLNGKADLDRIMFEYNKQNIRSNAKMSNSKISIAEEEIAEDNIVKNATKIDTKSDFDSDLNEGVEQNTQEISAKNEDVTKSLEQRFNQVINDDIEASQLVGVDEIPEFIKGESDKEEMIIGSDEDLDRGSEFIMQNIKSNKNNYYAEIKADLDKFFAMHPKNEELEKQVWGSKWVKIKADYDYSVGVIFDDNTPTIIAYAIPYEDINQIDMENLKFGEWLKVGNQPDENRGYFVYYQNAQTGEMIIN